MTSTTEPTVATGTAPVPVDIPEGSVPLPPDTTVATIEPAWSTPVELPATGTTLEAALIAVALVVAGVGLRCAAQRKEIIR